MRKHNIRFSFFCLAFAVLLMGACSPSNAQPTSETNLTPSASVDTLTVKNTSALDEYFVPPYYSQDYITIINASKYEKNLIIYSSMNNVNWSLVIDGFNAHYPWIKVTVKPMDTDQVFSQYASDKENNRASADLLVSYSADQWQFFKIAGNLDPYLSQEEFSIPGWAKVKSGMYGVASDPMILVFNSALVTDKPTSMQDIANWVTTAPDTWTRKIATIDPNSSQAAYLANWFWTRAKGEQSWELLKTINATTPFLAGDNDELLARVNEGASLVGYFASYASYAAKQSSYPNVGWSYISDGQPLLVHMAGITRAAENPNSARLMLDYLLSQEGQVAIGIGGLVPFRDDIAFASIFKQESPVRDNLIEIESIVGVANIIPFSMNDALTAPTARERLLNEWNSTFK